MMGDWLTYRPSDLLLFTPEAYWSLFAEGNTALWPLIPVFLALGVTLIAIGRIGPVSRRLALVSLAAIWVWVGWDFYATRYATINWAAPAVALAFALQAAVLLAFAFGALPHRSRPGAFLIAYAVLLHPLWPLLTGRPLAEAELLGLAPDPTAIATLGLALMLRGGVLLALVPALWLALSAATLVTMGAAEALAPVVVLVLWIGAVIWPGQDQPSRNAFR